MSDLMDFAKKELEIWTKGEMGEMMAEDVLEALNVLCEQGHSGLSAPIVISLLKRLWDWKPLTPLTGEGSEWTDELDPNGETLQNKRCPAVFKDKKTGKARYLDGRVFVEPDGSTFTCALSSVDIDFPYIVPDEPEYVYLMHKIDKMDVDEQWKKGAYSLKPLPKENENLEIQQ